MDDSEFKLILEHIKDRIDEAEKSNRVSVIIGWDELKSATNMTRSQLAKGIKSISDNDLYVSNHLGRYGVEIIKENE